MVVDTDLVQVIARRNAHWSHGYNFIEEKLLFVVKILGSDNIYILLGDLLSMYAVNRSSITAC